MPFILAFPGAQFVSEECGGGGAVAASVYERRCREVPVGHAGVSDGIEGGSEALPYEKATGVSEHQTPLV